MTDHQADLLTALLAKVTIAGLGVLCVYMGFTLFMRGVQKGGAGISGEAGAEGSGSKWRAAVALDKGGPGLVFALFGAAIAVVGILLGINIHEKTTTAPTAASPMVVVVERNITGISPTATIDRPRPMRPSDQARVAVHGTPDYCKGMIAAAGAIQKNKSEMDPALRQEIELCQNHSSEQ